MDLTKRQVRALVRNSSVDRREFGDAFESDRVFPDGRIGFQLEGTKEKPALVVVYGPEYIGEIDLISRKVKVKDPLMFDIQIVDNRVCVYCYKD